MGRWRSRFHRGIQLRTVTDLRVTGDAAPRDHRGDTAATAIGLRRRSADPIGKQSTISNSAWKAIVTLTQCAPPIEKEMDARSNDHAIIHPQSIVFRFASTGRSGGGSELSAAIPKATEAHSESAPTDSHTQPTPIASPHTLPFRTKIQIQNKRLAPKKYIGPGVARRMEPNKGRFHDRPICG